MERRFYTFLIFPGAHGKLRKIQLPFYMVHLMMVFTVIGLITAAALASSYARMLLKVAHDNSMRSEREALKTQYRSLENTVDQTNAKLDSLQSLAAEVALTYGFGEARRPRFPQVVLALAAQSNSTLDSSYRASLHAFDLLQKAAMAPPRESVALGMFARAQMNKTLVPTFWPVHGQVTAGFGQRLDPFSGEGTFHAGLDISAPFGTMVQAAGDGIVIYAGRDSGYGNEVLVNHGNGITTKYGHLSKIHAVIGQEVKRRQVIGTVGMTGRATGPHLHYEVCVNDTPVNPAKYLRQ